MFRHSRFCASLCYDAARVPLMLLCHAMPDFHAMPLICRAPLTCFTLLRSCATLRFAAYYAAANMLCRC